jgi:hypothetical protein
VRRRMRRSRREMPEESSRVDAAEKSHDGSKSSYNSLFGSASLSCTVCVIDLYSCYRYKQQL